MKYLSYLLFFIIISCAQQTVLTGGDKDISPPKLIKENDTIPSIVTNFKGQNLSFIFNENVQFLKGKRAIITNPKINDIAVLVEKTTYYILGRCIKREHNLFFFI